MAIIPKSLNVIIDHQRPRDRSLCVSGSPSTGSREGRLAGRTQCTAYACKHNLLVNHSEDRPGRPHNGKRPDWSFRDDTTPSSPSCCLDVVSTGPKGTTEIAEIMGVDVRRIQQIEEKLRDVAVAWAKLAQEEGV